MHCIFSDLPLVLHSLDLVIHAKHDMSHGVLLVVILAIIIIGIVEVRVNGVLIMLNRGDRRKRVIFFLDSIIVDSIVLEKSLKRGLLRTSCSVPCRLSQGQHQTTTFHLLCSGSHLLVKHPVHLHTAQLRHLAICTALHQHTLVTIGSAVHLRLAEAVLRVGLRCLTSTLLLLLLLLMQSGFSLCSLLCLVLCNLLWRQALLCLVGLTSR